MKAIPPRKTFHPRQSVALTAVAPEDLLGLADIARQLGVSKRTAQNYVSRADFPEPLGRISAGPVWMRRHVEEWAKATLPLRTGRPPKSKQET